MPGSAARNRLFSKYARASARNDVGVYQISARAGRVERWRTAGFPRYGSKAGCQSAPCQGKADRSTPHRGLPPTFVSPRDGGSASLEVEVPTLRRHRRASGLSALPQGPSLRSGLCCPSPSSLNRPYPPHSAPHFPRLASYMQRLYGARLTSGHTQRPQSLCRGWTRSADQTTLPFSPDFGFQFAIAPADGHGRFGLKLDEARRA